jgi:hypothetical protein
MRLEGVKTTPELLSTLVTSIRTASDLAKTAKDHKLILALNEIGNEASELWILVIDLDEENRQLRRVIAEKANQPKIEDLDIS